MPVIFLLDDERVFADQRDAIVTRTVEEAIEAANQLAVIDELWLDFVLTPGDTLPFLKYLTKRNKTDNPLTVRKVIFHSSAYAAMDLIRTHAQQAGIDDVDLPDFSVKVSVKTIE